MQRGETFRDAVIRTKATGPETLSCLAENKPVCLEQGKGRGRAAGRGCENSSQAWLT